MLEAGSFRQGFHDDVVRYPKTVACFVTVCAKWQGDPRFVEIPRLGRHARVDQHRRCFNTVGFHADAVDLFAKTGKHFAADLPAVQLDRGVGCGGTGKGAANLINGFPAHHVTMCEGAVNCNHDSGNAGRVAI